MRANFRHLMRLLYSFILALFFITPYAQPYSFESRGIGGGGSLFSPSINPTNPEEIYVACDMTQLFHTQNGASEWSMIDFQKLVVTPQSEIQFHNNANVLQTVGLDFRNDITYPARSIDGGQNWFALNTPQPDGVYYLYSDFQNEDRFIVSDYRRIYLTNNSGSSYSTIEFNEDGTYIAGVVWDGNSIYIGTNYGVIFSNDNGATFNDMTLSGLPTAHGFSSFGGVVSQNGPVLSGIIYPTVDIYPGVQASEYRYYVDVYKLEVNLDNAWVNISPQNIPATHKFFQIAHSNNKDIIYIAGTDSDTSFPIVYKSIDGGLQWTSIFNTTDNENISTAWCGYLGDENWWYAESAMGFTVSASDPDHVVITDFGGIHETHDGGQSWHAKYLSNSDTHPSNAPTPRLQSYASNGLENTSGWWIHWKDDVGMWAGFSDVGGIFSSDQGMRWSYDKIDRSYNSTYQIIEHPSNGTLYAATSSIHDMYQSTRLKDIPLDDGSGAILMSQNDGTSWEVMHDFDHPVMWMDFDPTNPNIMYASVVHSTLGGIYKTSNAQLGASSSWTRLSVPPGTEGHPLTIIALTETELVCSYSGRRIGNGFTDSSGVFYSDNGGSSWINKGISDMDYWTKDIVIDPHDSSLSTWYVCVFSGWGGAGNTSGGLYRTKDRGLTWQKISNHYRVESVSFHPDYSNILYLTTEDDGLWVSQNIQDLNPQFSRVTAYNFQHPMRVFFEPENANQLWVTSFGNGLRLGDISCLSTLHLDGRPISSNNYGAAVSIQSAGLIDLAEGDVEFKAGNYISLSPDFEVSQGAAFLATIYQCE